MEQRLKKTRSGEMGPRKSLRREREREFAGKGRALYGCGVFWRHVGVSARRLFGSQEGVNLVR